MDGEAHTVCPRRPLFDQPREFGYWLGIYRDWKKGILPEAGARMDQSAYVLEMVSIMDGVYATVQEAMEQEAEKNARRGGAAGGRPKGTMHSRS
jgi:hypothetical protein